MLKQYFTQIFLFLSFTLIGFHEALAQNYTTNASPYCSPSYSIGCSPGDRITFFRLGNFQNANGPCNNDNYKYFDSLTIEVRKGRNYSIEIQDGSTFAQEFGIWIDYNQDGTFGTGKEFVYQSGNNNFFPNDTAFGNIQIPISAKTGKTRLRVKSEYASIVNQNDYCTSSTFGETEDYDIFINPLRFQKTYGDSLGEKGYDADYSEDGGLIITGGTRSFGSGMEEVFLTRGNDQGQQQWFKTFGGSSRDVAKSVTPAFDSGYLMAGHTQSYGSGASDFYLVKSDENGNQKWAKAYGGNNTDSAMAVHKTSDTGYVVAGSSGSFGASTASIYVMKIDTSGNVIWENQYGNLSDGTDEAYSIIEDSAGHILVTGSTQSYGAGNEDVFLMKLDGAGNEQWFKTYGGTQDEVGKSLLQSERGNYIITGSTQSTGSPLLDGFFMKTDTAGFVQTYRTYGGGQDEAFHQVAELNNNSFLLSGYTKSYGQGKSDAFNAYVDSFGQVLWGRTYGSTGNDRLLAASAQQSEVFLNVGFSDSLGFGQNDIFLLFSDSTGQGCNQSPVTNFDQSASVTGVNQNITTNPVNANTNMGVTVNTPAVKTYILCPVNADFVALDTCREKPTQFIDSTFDNQYPGYSWSWDFGDTVSANNAATAQDPTHSFSSTGFFEVELVASNPVTADTVSKFVQIFAPSFQIITKDTNLCANDSIQVDLDNTFANYNWTPGSRVSDSTIKNPYAYPGEEELVIAVQDASGCGNRDTIQVDFITGSGTKAPSFNKLTTINDSSIKISWDTASNKAAFQAYQLYNRPKGTDSFQLVKNLTNFDSTTWSDTKVPQADSLQYQYALRVKDSCGIVGDTNQIFTSLILNSQAIGDKGIDLNWTPHQFQDSSKYQVLLNDSVLIDAFQDTTYQYYACTINDTFRVRAIDTLAQDTITSNWIQPDVNDTINPQKPALYYTTTKSDSTLEISWAPSSGDVNRYVVYRTDGSGNFTAIDTNYTRTDTNYTDTLSTGIKRSYCYKVAAIDSCANNQSPLSEQHCTIYLTSDTKGCQQEISLSWNKYEGFDTVQQYEIYRQKEGGSRNFLATVDSSVTSYVDSQVDFNFSYTYDIKALDKNSAFTSASNDTTNRTFKPNTPFVKSASKLTTYPDTGKVKISWKNQQSEPKLTYQKLYYKAPDSNNFDLLQDSIPLTQDTLIHDSLNTKYKDHRYYLITVDNCGNESDSVSIHKTMELEFDVGQLAHDLSWTPYEGWPVKHYLVQRSQGGVFKTLDSLPAGDTSIFKQPEPCNFPISYRIKAVDSQGNYAYSDTGINEAIDTISPNGAELQNVTVAKDSLVDVTFNGADSLDIFSYDVMRKRENGNYQLAKRVIFNSPGGTFTVTDTTNTRPDQLTYKVLTQDSCLNTVSSDSFTATQLEGQEQNLQNLLTWHQFDGYPVDSQFVLEKNGANYDTLAKLGSADTSYLHNNLRCNRPHSYKVVSFEQGGNRQTLSDSIRLTPFDTVKPAAPNLFRATVQNSDSIRIAWDTSTDIDVNKYEVFYAKQGQNFQSAGIVNQENKPQNAFVQQAINPKANSYCYYVEAIDSCSGVHSMPSDTHCVMELNGEPGNLRSELSWAPYSGSKPVDSYTVQRRQDGPWQDIAVINGNDTTYTDSQNLRCNQYYRYRIRAKWEDDSTLTSLSDTSWVKPFDTVKPAAPDLRNATVQNSDSVKLTWDTSTDIDVNQYEIFYAKKGKSFQSAGIVNQENKPQNDFIQQAINPKSRSYCYYVEAIDSCSSVNSLPSDTHCVMQLEAKGGQRENHLYWDAYTGPKVDSFTVERLFSGGWQSIASVPGTDTSYTDDSSTRCNIPYRYRIRAHWNDGSSFTSGSDSARAVPFDTVTPAKPNINAFSVIGKDSAEVTWQHSDGDVKQYELWVKSKQGTWQNRDTVGVQTRYTFGNLNTLDSQYCTRIVAIDSCSANRSGFSKKHCAIQLTTTAGQKENYLNWEAYEGWSTVDKYYIYNQNPADPGWAIIDTVLGTDTSYTHGKLPCNRPQYYKVEGKSASGYRAFSDSIEQTPFDTVSPDAPAIRYVNVKNPDTIEGFFDTAKARDLGEYVVYAKAGNQPYQPIDTIADTGQAKNQFTHTGIRPDTAQYCYRVRTIDSCAGNQSAFSKKHCAVQLQGTAGNLETHLNWHPYEGFFNPTYHIQRKTTNTSWQTLGSKTDTSFNDTQSLACNVTYTYRIRTVSPSGSDTSYSDTLNLQPFDTTAPPVPQLRFASANLQDEVELEWAWDTKSDQKYFEIWRDQGNGNYVNLDTITYDSTFLNASATPGQTDHAYFVRAIDSCAANGAIGAPGNRSKPSDTDRIMVPEVATGACQPEARLKWTPYADLPQGVDFYRIHRRDSNSSNFQQVARVGDTAYTDSNILDHTHYCYRIEAVDTQSGYTAYSDSICMKPFVYPIPDTARIKRTTVTKTGQSNGEILVEWERSPRSDTFARGYYIYHRQNGGNYALIHNQTDLDDTTFRHKGINTAKFPHEYRIVIYNLCLEDGGYRKVHRPVKLYGKNHNLEVALDWLPYQGFDVQKYEVQRSVNGGTFRSLDTLMNRDTSYRDSSVRCGNLYSYRIYAEGSKGHEQSLSDSIGFVAYDTIPPDKAEINQGTITKTGKTNGIAELDFEPATQANRKGYIIYRSEGNSRFVPVDTVFSGATNTITYQDNGINTKDTRLGYYIKSFDSCGNVAAPSDTHQLINLQAEAMNLANEVNWTAYQGWNDWLYELQRRTPNTNWATIARQDTGNRTFTDSTKNCDTLYYYRVKAINSNTGGVSYSNYDTARSIDREAPEPPEPERVTVQENGNVLVEWNEFVSNDAEFDHLFKKPTSSNNFELQTNNLQTANYTDSQSKANEEPISYRLRSEDSCDNVSSPSDIHTTIHLQAEPGQEQNELTWTPYEGWDVATYEVYRDGNQLTEVDGEELSYTDVRAVCTTYHNYRVRALKAGDTTVTSWSNTDSAQAQDNTPPQGVNLTTATVVGPNEVVEVRWEASTSYDASGYEIYRSGLNSNGLTAIATIEGAETTRFRDSLSSPVNQQFCYQVRVRDFCGNRSQRSNKGCIMGIEGEATEGAHTISWDEYNEWPGNVAYYDIYKKEDSSFYEQIAQVDGKSSNYEDDDLANRVTDFCYQVEAHHSKGDETSRSFEICLRQPQIVHIPNSFTPGITEGQNDKFGPEGLYIENYEMQIFNRWGEEIFSTKSAKPWDGTYEGQPAPAGIYLYSITITGEDGRQDSYKGSLTIVR